MGLKGTERRKNEKALRLLKPYTIVENRPKRILSCRDALGGSDG